MKYITLLLLLLGLISCRKRLDSFLFNPSKLNFYQLDNYQGEVSLDLAGQYSVPQNMIHFVEFPITENGKTIQIKGIYLGDTATIS